MRAIFAKTYLDDSILKTGYIDWNPARYNNYTLQAEYKNFGPGYNATARATANFTVQLTDKEWSVYGAHRRCSRLPRGSLATQHGLIGAFERLGVLGDSRRKAYVGKEIGGGMLLHI